MKIIGFIAIYCLGIISFLYSQDTIIIVNGKHINTNEYKIDNLNREFIYINKKGKGKSIFLDNIFSINDSLGNEKIIYNPDNNNLYKYSVDEMRDFMQGGYDASNFYKSPLSIFYGFISGAGSTILIQNPIYAIFPSGAICVIIGLPNVSHKRIEKRFPKYSDNNFYYLGFNQEAKNKRFINSIKGASAGIISGLTIIILQLNDVIPQITFN